MELDLLGIRMWNLIVMTSIIKYTLAGNGQRLRLNNYFLTREVIAN